MKKAITLLMTFLIIITSMILVIGCKDTTEALVEYSDIKIPENLKSGQLGIEWLGGVDKNKPTMIYIHGYSENYKKTSLNLDDAVYTKAIYDNYIADKFSNNIVALWQNFNFNIGIFHYEQFADDSETNVLGKIYDNSNLTYTSSDENATKNYEKTNSFKHNLTEVFAAVWLKEFKAYGFVNEDLRFIGNGFGANLALSATDYLNHFYKLDKVDQYALPSRLTMADPVLLGSIESNKISFNLSEKAKNQSTEVAKSMIAIEIIDSVKTTYGETDKANFDALLKNVAYLELSQKYSTLYPDSYQNYKRAALDWYIATIGGSDVDYVSNTDYNGLNDSKPFFDKNTEESYSTYQKFGLSAWTPTFNTFLAKGTYYKMEEKYYDSESSTEKWRDYSLEKFRTENRQRSTGELVTYLSGILFSDFNADGFANDGRHSRIPNAEILITLKDYNDSSNDITLRASTNSFGFYSIKLPSEFVSHSVDINIATPSKNHQHGLQPAQDVGNFRLMSANAFATDDLNMYISSGNKGTHIIRNAGFIFLP